MHTIKILRRGYKAFVVAAVLLILNNPAEVSATALAFVVNVMHWLISEMRLKLVMSTRKKYHIWLALVIKLILFISVMLICLQVSTDFFIACATAFITFYVTVLYVMMKGGE